MVFIRRQIDSLRGYPLDHQVSWLESRTSPRGLLAGRRTLQRDVREFRPDVLHAHFGTATALVAASVSAPARVVSYRGSDLNPDPTVSKLRSAMQKLFSQVGALRATRIVCVSDELRGRLWWGRGRADVFSDGIDTRLFVPRDRDEARRELGWPLEERVAFLNAGRTPLIKGVELAREALEIASREAGPVRLEMLEGRTDPREVPLRIAASDCVLMTSLYEGSPNIVKEAVLSCVPVVAVAVGDVPAVLEGVEPSRLCARDAAEIGGAVAEFARRPQRSNGVERAEAFSLETTAEKLYASYCSAAGLER